MITRRSRIQRTTRVRKRRATRRGPWRCEKYRRWIASMECAICGDERTQESHTVNNGRSSKGPDSSCVPLCVKHHDELDGRTKMPYGYVRGAFEALYGVDLAEIAASLFAVWQARNNSEPPCECEMSGDQADARNCDLHNPSSKYNRMRPELPRMGTSEDTECPI